jgi:hypothetical protein
MFKVKLVLRYVNLLNRPDRERFRRTTISEAQAMQQRMESSKDVYKQDRTEHRLIRLMKVHKWYLL